MVFTEAEKQILFTIRHLSNKKPPNREKVMELRELIMGNDLIEWGGSLDDLLERGIVLESNGWLTLSNSIKEEAERLYLEWSADGFSEELIKSEESAAYSDYCKRLYGVDLCQFNMMDMKQLDKLLEVLSLNPKSRVLELGCGIGTITEYISDTTGARITGVDFAAGAIDRARERSVTKRDRLTFVVQNMDSLDFPAGAFDTIIAIDTLYFVSSLEQTIGHCKELLEPGGQMGLLYSQHLRPEESDELLQPSNTNLACQLQKHGLSYEYWDYSEDEREHWRQSKKIAEDMKSDFKSEDNLDIYESRVKESEHILKTVNAGRTSRYLYLVRK